MRKDGRVRGLAPFARFGERRSGQCHRRGQPFDDIRGKARPRENHDTGPRHSFRRKFVHELARAPLDSLGADNEREPVPDGGSDGFQHFAANLCRYRQNYGIGANQVIEIGLAPRPDRDLMAGGTCDEGQCLSPGSGSGDRDVPLHALAPSLPAP